VPSVAASMIANLRDKPSHEDELTSKAVPATMYIGMLSPFVTLFDADEIVRCIPIRWSRYSQSAHLIWDLDNNYIQFLLTDCRCASFILPRDGPSPGRAKQSTKGDRQCCGDGAASQF
jgi:hypothetical protein